MFVVIVRWSFEEIDDARAQGLDITTEVYPYTAWSTFIGASIFNGDWTAAPDPFHACWAITSVKKVR